MGIWGDVLCSRLIPGKLYNRQLEHKERPERMILVDYSPLKDHNLHNLQSQHKELCMYVCVGQGFNKVKKWTYITKREQSEENHPILLNLEVHPVCLGELPGWLSHPRKQSQYLCPCGESLFEVASKRTNFSWKGAKRSCFTVWEGLVCPSIKLLLLLPAVLICSVLQTAALLRHDDGSVSHRTSGFPFIISSPYDAP